MLPKRQARCDVGTLTSEYLDGVCSPTRLTHLGELLETRKDCREQFVGQVQLHGMLCDYFKQAGSKQQTPEVETVAQADEPPARRRRCCGKARAA